MNSVSPPTRTFRKRVVFDLHKFSLDDDTVGNNVSPRYRLAAEPGPAVNPQVRQGRRETMAFISIRSVIPHPGKDALVAPASHGWRRATAPARSTSRPPSTTAKP